MPAPLHVCYFGLGSGKIKTVGLLQIHTNDILRIYVNDEVGSAVQKYMNSWFLQRATSGAVKKIIK